MRNGLLVESVQPGSGAAVAGLRGGSAQVVVAGESYTLGGDEIVRVDGRRVSTVDALRDVLGNKQLGDRVTLGVYRGSQHLTLTTKLGRQPSSPNG